MENAIVDEPKQIDYATARETLESHLIGSSINSVTYFITGWSLRMISPSNPECILHASEITLTNIHLWRKKLTDLPVAILNTNEPDDVIVASVIFSVVNKWPISNIQILDEGDLIIGFENNAEIRIKGLVKYVDWTWQVDCGDRKSLVFCDSGVLTTQTN